MQPPGSYFLSRFKELPIWLGIPFLGACAGDQFSFGPRLNIFIITIILAMFHVLLLNDWGDLARNPFEKKRYSEKINIFFLQFFLKAGSIVVFMAAILLGGQLVSPVVLFILSGSGIILSLLYSHPLIHLKQNIIGASVIHFLGGTLQFILGYIVFSEHWQNGIVVGVFFALVFTAGHFIHECLDIQEDREGNIKTRATRFGIRHTLRVASMVYLAAHIYLLVITMLKLLPLEWSGIFLIQAIVHLFFIKKVIFSAEPTSQNLMIYQRSYRLAFAGCCVVFFLSRLFHIYKSQ